MAGKGRKMSIDLNLDRRAQRMPINSASKKNDIERPDLACTTYTQEEQMAKIMTLQLDKLEKITSEINLLRSGFGHIDTQVDKVQVDLDMLHARRGNDASLPQTELGVQTQASEDTTMSDEGEELSDSDESEEESRGKLAVVVKLPQSAELLMKDWNHLRVSQELFRRSATKRLVRMLSLLTNFPKF